MGLIPNQSPIPTLHTSPLDTSSCVWEINEGGGQKWRGEFWSLEVRENLEHRSKH